MISVQPKKRLTTLLLTTPALLMTGSHLAWSQVAPANPASAPPPLANAYNYYEAAGNLLVGLAQIRAATRNTASIAEKEDIVHQNGGALKLLHQGFADSSAKAFMPPGFRVSQERDLARLLAVAGDVQAAHKNQAGAVTNYLGAMQLGLDVGRGAGVTAMLSGIALEEMGRRSLFLGVNKLTGQQAKAAVQKLQTIESHRVVYSDVLGQEEKAQQQDLATLFKDDQWRKSFPTAQSEQQITRDFTLSIDAIIADAKLPYPARQVSQKLPPDPVNQLMLSNYADRAGMSFLETKDRTQNALLMAMLALQAYKMAHQAYPQNLTQLVPEYLQKVPADPFALSGPLRYRSPGDSYVLYSIGPDGKDDLGQPIYDPKTAPPASYHVAADSVGDIVAGTNTR